MCHYNQNCLRTVFVREIGGEQIEHRCLRNYSESIPNRAREFSEVNRAPGFPEVTCLHYRKLVRTWCLIRYFPFALGFVGTSFSWAELFVDATVPSVSGVELRIHFAQLPSSHFRYFRRL